MLAVDITNFNTKVFKHRSLDPDQKPVDSFPAVGHAVPVRRVAVDTAYTTLIIRNGMRQHSREKGGNWFEQVEKCVPRKASYVEQELSRGSNVGIVNTDNISSCV